jgi:hypothetical protein
MAHPTLYPLAIAEVAGREQFITAPDPCPALARVRSSLLIASIATVRKLGHFDAYAAALAEGHRAALLECVAGVWLPLDRAIAHYRACDALGLADEAQVNIGRSVGMQLHGTLTSLVLRMVKEGGVTPWAVMSQFARLWTHSFDGSALAGWRLGPKEARLDVLGTPLCRSRYFRNALRGQAMTILDFFCTKSYLIERPGAAKDTLSCRVQWV